MSPRPVAEPRFAAFLDTYQTKMAGAIVSGIKSYVTKYPTGSQSTLAANETADKTV